MESRKDARLRRARKTRAQIRRLGKPRLTVHRSGRHIYAQVIDDVSRTTLVSASDMEPALKAKINGKKKSDVATIVGDLVAERAKGKGVSKVVFDRGGYPFHGRIKALAEAARSGGLEF